MVVKHLVDVPVPKEFKDDLKASEADAIADAAMREALGL